MRFSNRMMTPVVLYFPFWILFSIHRSTALKNGSLLGESCLQNSDCFPPLSECNTALGVCTCKAYSVRINSTTCLPGTLLGFQCEADSQCSVKVPWSGCVNGICACGLGYVGYRRHTCLAPANLGEVCFETEQCTLRDRGSYCKYIVPKVYGRCQCQSGRELNGKNKCSASIETKIGEGCQEDSDCGMANAFCHRKLDGGAVCTCDIAYTPSTDRLRCLATYRGLLSATSLGHACHAHLECQLADPNSICNAGVCDCASGNATTCGSNNTGCYKHTFQCRSDGKCISWHMLCDGEQDCEDGSDEACELEEGDCPPQTFQCRHHESGMETTGVLDRTQDSFQTSPTSRRHSRIQCISRSKRCNGVKDCKENNSDEENCNGEKSCPPGTFPCAKTKKCLPEQQFCNAIADCSHSDLSDEDELKCRTEFQPSEYCPFRCKNGLCRSSAILCSGIDGCGDGSDESKCSVCRCPRRIPS